MTCLDLADLAVLAATVFSMRIIVALVVVCKTVYHVSVEWVLKNWL